MPSLRRSTIADLRQRVVSGENGSMKGMPFACCLEPADELADVLSHFATARLRFGGSKSAMGAMQTTGRPRLSAPP